VTFEYTWSETNLGASQNFEQLNASFFDAETVGRHTFLASARYGTTIQSDAPVQNLFTLGGPFRLSGLEQDQLTGQHYGMALLGYRLRLVQSGLLPPYAGATVEFGNAANERHNIIDDGIWNGNVYVGFNTFIGPLYAGYGFAEGGHRSYYLRIGTLVGGPSQLGR
jgi:NTE family protein